MKKYLFFCLLFVVQSFAQQSLRDSIESHNERINALQDSINNLVGASGITSSEASDLIEDSLHFVESNDTVFSKSEYDVFLLSRGRIIIDREGITIKDSAGGVPFGARIESLADLGRIGIDAGTSVMVNGLSGRYGFNNSGFIGDLWAASLSNDRDWVLPDISGTVAMRSDIEDSLQFTEMGDGSLRSNEDTSLQLGGLNSSYRGVTYETKSSGDVVDIFRVVPKDPDGTADWAFRVQEFDNSYTGSKNVTGGLEYNPGGNITDEVSIGIQFEPSYYQGETLSEWFINWTDSTQSFSYRPFGGFIARDSGNVEVDMAVDNFQILDRNRGTKIRYVIPQGDGINVVIYEDTSQLRYSVNNQPFLYQYNTSAGSIPLFKLNERNNFELMPDGDVTSGGIELNSPITGLNDSTPVYFGNMGVSQLSGLAFSGAGFTNHAGMWWDGTTLFLSKGATNSGDPDDWNANFGTDPSANFAVSGDLTVDGNATFNGIVDGIIGLPDTAGITTGYVLKKQSDGSLDWEEDISESGSGVFNPDDTWIDTTALGEATLSQAVKDSIALIKFKLTISDTTDLRTFSDSKYQATISNVADTSKYVEKADSNLYATQSDLLGKQDSSSVLDSLSNLVSSDSGLIRFNADGSFSGYNAGANIVINTEDGTISATGSLDILNPTLYAHASSVIWNDGEFTAWTIDSVYKSSADTAYIQLPITVYSDMANTLDSIIIEGSSLTNVDSVVWYHQSGGINTRAGILTESAWSTATRGSYTGSITVTGVIKLYAYCGGAVEWNNISAYLRSQ